MAKRKTAADRQNEDARREHDQHRRFAMQLDDIKSAEDAIRTANHGPLSHEPGGQWYTNFGAFLHGYPAENFASIEELGLYLKLLQRFRSEGKKLFKDDEGAINYLENTIAKKRQ